MRKVLVVVDMQNDFIDGALGTAEAEDRRLCLRSFIFLGFRRNI